MAQAGGGRHTSNSKATTTLSIMLVDDHPMWRESLKKVIERSGVGTVTAEASHGGEAVDTAAATMPDLVVMDMALPIMGGVEATRRIRSMLPDVKVLVLSSFEAKASVLEAVRAGASGYLLKTAGAKEVADAMRRVAEGELVFPPRLAGVVLEEFRRLSNSDPSHAPYRVMLVGDSPVHREAVARLLGEDGFEVAGVGGDAEEITPMLDANLPDIVILDFHATPDKGLRIAAHIRTVHPHAHILVLGQDSESSQAYELLASASEGVGYLLRDRLADLDELRDAIRRVAGGESVVDPAVVHRLVEKPRSTDKLAALTAREREVLGLMAEGRSNQAISEALFLSGKTLEKHIRAIFTKLELDETPDDHRRVRAVLAYLRS